MFVLGVLCLLGSLRDMTCDQWGNGLHDCSPAVVLLHFTIGPDACSLLNWPTSFGLTKYLDGPQEFFDMQPHSGYHIFQAIGLLHQRITMAFTS